MPFKSKKQQRFMNANKTKLARKGVDVEEFNKKSKGKKLPESKRKKKGRKKGRSDAR